MPKAVVLSNVFCWNFVHKDIGQRQVYKKGLGGINSAIRLLPDKICDGTRDYISLGSIENRSMRPAL